MGEGHKLIDLPVHPEAIVDSLSVKARRWSSAAGYVRETDQGTQTLVDTLGLHPAGLCYGSVGEGA